MSTIVADLPEADISFESAGQFIGTPGWIHEHRILDSFELIFVKRGILPLRVGADDLRIGGCDIAIIPPQTPHEGTGYLTDTLEFFWVHFRIRHWRRSGATDGTPSAYGDRTLMLPLSSSQMDTDRLTIMFNQLLDIYQMSYPEPSSYCDYFTTCLLYEVVSLNNRAATADNDQRERHVLQKVHEWIRINAFEDISVDHLQAAFRHQHHHADLEDPHRARRGAAAVHVDERAAGGRGQRLQRREVLHARLQTAHRPDPHPLPHQLHHAPLQQRVSRAFPPAATTP